MKRFDALLSLYLLTTANPPYSLYRETQFEDIAIVYYLLFALVQLDDGFDDWPLVYWPTKPFYITDLEDSRSPVNSYYIKLNI